MMKWLDFKVESYFDLLDFRIHGMKHPTEFDDGSDQ